MNTNTNSNILSSLKTEMIDMLKGQGKQEGIDLETINNLRAEAMALMAQGKALKVGDKIDAAHQSSKSFFKKLHDHMKDAIGESEFTSIVEKADVDSDFREVLNKLELRAISLLQWEEDYIAVCDKEALAAEASAAKKALDEKAIALFEEANAIAKKYGWHETRKVTADDFKNKKYGKK